MGNYYSYEGPTVQDRSGEILADGIKSGVGSLLAGIQQGVTKRDEAKAADAEFDVIKEMYPEMAQFEDKFHSSNLSGKQGILGQAKGYVMKNAEEKERQEKFQAAKTLTGIKTEDGATMYVNGLGQLVHTTKPAEPPPLVTFQDVPGTKQKLTLVNGMPKFTATMDSGPTAEGLGIVQGPNGERVYSMNGKPVSPSNIMVQKPGPYAPGQGIVPITAQDIPSRAPEGLVPKSYYDKSTGVTYGLPASPTTPRGATTRITPGIIFGGQ